MADSKDTESFVTRRGKRVSSESLNMSDLTIDNVPGEALETYTTPRERTNYFSGVLRSKFLWIGLVVLLLIPVVAGEVLTYQYSAADANAKSKLAQLVSNDVRSIQSKKDLSAAQIGDIQTKVNDIATRMCRGGVLDNAAQLYPRAKSAHSACVESQTQFSSLANSLGEYTSQRRYMEDLASIITPLSEPLTEQFAVISAQLELWQRARPSIEGLRPPSSFSDLHTSLVASATSIESDWSRLYNAYNDQDAAQFNKAQANLTKHFKEFQATADEFRAAITATQQQIIDTHTAIKA